MATYSLIEQLGLTLDDFREWNLNSSKAFQKFFNAFGKDATGQMYIERRIFCGSASDLHQEFDQLYSTALAHTIEALDNWINQGDEQSGQAWEYQTPPIEPPGEPGTKLWRLLSSTNSDKAAGMKRNYRGHEFINRSLEDLFQTWRRLLKKDLNLCKRRHFSNVKILSYSESICTEDVESSLQEPLDYFEDRERSEEFEMLDKMGTPLEILVNSDDESSPCESISRRLAILAKQAADNLLQAQNKSRGRSGVPYRFILFARLFLLYVLETCVTRERKPALAMAFPPSLPRFIAGKIGLKLDRNQIDEALTLLTVQWTQAVVNHASILPELTPDHQLVRLIERLSQQVAPTEDADEFQSRLRNTLLLQIGNRELSKSEPTSRPPSPRYVGIKHLQELAAALENQRWQALKSALTDNSWRNLETSVNSSDWPGLIERIDAQTWRNLLDSGFNLSPDVFLNELYGYKSFYQMWHQGCMRLLAAGEDRRALDTAKSRLETQDSLTQFYAFIGAWHRPKNELCGKITNQFADFLEGDVNPDNAAQIRQHFQTCHNCMQELDRYVTQRIAWGYQPQPQVAYLREKLNAAVDGRFKRLKTQLGTLLTDRLSWPQLPMTNINGALLAGTAAQEKEETSSSVMKEGQDHLMFKGFNVQTGDIITIRILEIGRQLPIITGQVIASTCVPDDCTASVTIAMNDKTLEGHILAARFSYGDTSYSLTSEIRKGMATIAIFEAPIQLPEIKIEVWYTVSVG